MILPLVSMISTSTFTLQISYELTSDDLPIQEKFVLFILHQLP